MFKHIGNEIEPIHSTHFDTATFSLAMLTSPEANISQNLRTRCHQTVTVHPSHNVHNVRPAASWFHGWKYFRCGPWSSPRPPEERQNSMIFEDIS